MSAEKSIYFFADGKADGNGQMKDLLGGKGAGLAEMTNAKLPVPPGFTITTRECNAYFENGRKLPEGLWSQVLEAMSRVEKLTGKGFGDPKNPLLVSVRSGAKFSMPGMMDTVLNLGLNDRTVDGLAALSGNARFAWDAYRRFLQMFGAIVLRIPAERFHKALDAKKHARGVEKDTDLNEADLRELKSEFQRIIEAETGKPFPMDPREQLQAAVTAVFDSWFGKRAQDYRKFHGIPNDLGTAVNVQTMVFGNLGFDSCTGVAFTRDPGTGEHRFFGEYLLNAQGEDVVAGIRTPNKVEQMGKELPEPHRQLTETAKLLETHYKDMQDLEFTVERGRLYMLQTRTGKRTASAAVRIAVEMVEEGLIGIEEAISRVEPDQVVQLLLPRFDEKSKKAAAEQGRVLAKGLNASPGGATGEAWFDADRAEHAAQQGKAVILVRPETNPDDVHGMLGARGILTARGGATSHAAVVARGLGKPCVAGCEALHIDLETRQMLVDGKTVREGEFISIDGTTGEVFQGKISTIEADLDKEVHLKKILQWADERRRLQVWANADYPADARRARAFGAQGIGLCRTEHMFFEQERLPIMREFILANDDAGRQVALDKLLVFQRSDFEGIFEAMDGLPVIIRLLDPPLHEFLPRHEELQREVWELRAAVERGEDKKAELDEKGALLAKVEHLREANPMLGLRGCRLGLTFPALNRMQTRAILEAACNQAAAGRDVHPEIMVPLVAVAEELRRTREHIVEEAERVFAEKKMRVSYKIGTMIELPRAALAADGIAQHADFFSFGTNDLTQTTFGFSRDDAEGKFLLMYLEQGILPKNPFQQLDQRGVGRLMSLAVEYGKSTRPDLEVGICGEHGGDPSSVDFCHRTGLNYVSCSPFRVPVARLAAAQSVLRQGSGQDAKLRTA
jgi:pyruvate, orthophosphate dikinase